MNMITQEAKNRQAVVKPENGKGRSFMGETKHMARQLAKDTNAAVTAEYESDRSGGERV